MVTTICFLDDVEVALKEAYRIIKPSGSLIIGFIDKDSPLGKLYQQRKRKSVFYDVATFYSLNEIVSQLKKAGFKDFNFAQTIFHDLAEITDIEPVKAGHGEGSFVVVRAIKWKVRGCKAVWMKTIIQPVPSTGFNKCYPERCAHSICAAGDACLHKAFFREQPYDFPMHNAPMCVACGSCSTTFPLKSIRMI